MNSILYRSPAPLRNRDLNFLIHLIRVVTDSEIVAMVGFYIYRRQTGSHNWAGTGKSSQKDADRSCSKRPLPRQVNTKGFS